MSKFKVKKIVTDNSVTLVNTNILRQIQHTYLYQNVIDGITNSTKAGDTRILIGQAPTNSGKSFVLVNVSIPALIQQFPHIESVVFTSPDSGCVAGPYLKFKELWHNKLIKNRLGQSVRLRVIDKNQFNEDLKSDKEFISTEPVVEVLFATTQLLGRKWGDYANLNNTTYNLLKPDLVIVDEIHYGMGTISCETIFEDQGRTNNQYDPHWLPILTRFAQLGTHVIGFTGTPTNSQLGNTTQGSHVFKQLPVMPKDKDATAFVDGWTSVSPEQVFTASKQTIEEDLTKLSLLLSKITTDTWNKAKDINIVSKMPGAFFKFGRMNASNGVPLKNGSGINGHDTRFKSWAKSVGADYGVVTCFHKEYQKTGKTVYNYPHVDSAIDVINRANNETNFSVPVFLAVIQQGNMGWDIPRLKYVSVLTQPTGKNVTNMQQQLMARGNRLPFANMHSHNMKAEEIASLDVSTEQKKLLAEYVVFMCSTVVFFSRESSLMYKAYNEFKKETYSSEEGMKIYMDAIDNYVPKHNVTAFKSPRFTKGYSAGNLNQLYKKHYCEACTEQELIDPATSKTFCEVFARMAREKLRGSAFTDAEWGNVWFHTLVVDHKNGDRTDYRPENLITQDPTINGVKTYDSKDYLNKYDSFGKRVSVA